MLNTVLRDGMINDSYYNFSTQKHKMKPAELNSHGIKKNLEASKAKLIC